MALSNKSYEYEFTDFEQVAIEKNDKKREKEIAINMLKKGSEVDFVSEVIGLTISEVEELKKNLK